MMFALAAVACWSTVATAFKLALAQQSLTQLLWLANVVTVVTLGGLLLLRRQLFSALLGLRKHWKMGLLLGSINPFCYYLILFSAYNRLPAQVAQPINYTWAITLSVLAVPILGQKFVLRDLLSMLVAYGGVVLISIGGQSSGQPVTLSGILLALASTFLWAGYWLVNTRDAREPVTAIFQNFLIALPLTTLAFLVMDGNGRWSLESVLSAVYVGLFEMGITFVFWLTALKLASRASLVSNLIFLSPFVSLILISQVLGEKIGYLTVAGLVLIVVALMYQNRVSPETAER